MRDRCGNLLDLTPIYPLSMCNRHQKGTEMRVDWLLRVRPAFVAVLLKRAVQVQRAPYKTQRA